jgi:hypothetical protein
MSSMMVEEWGDHRTADDAEGQQGRDRTSVCDCIAGRCALGDEDSSGLE